MALLPCPRGSTRPIQPPEQEFRRMPSDLNISPHMWDGGGVLRVARISVWEMYSEWTRAMSVVGEMCSFVQ